MNVTKKIMELLDLLKTNKAKVLFLAGLMGLASSCNVDEPEFSGNFMQNMPVSVVKNAVFYEPAEETQSFSFQTNNNTVTGVTFVKDVKDTKTEIYNPMNLTRTDSYLVRNGEAHFVSPWYWSYDVKLQRNIVWDIPYVTDEEYNSKYKNMSDQDLADLAKNRIQSKNPEATDYATEIYDGILARKGSWKQNPPFYMKISSKAQEQNLRYSDFGRIYCFSPNGNIPSYESGERLYSGGVPSNKIDKSMVSPQTFKVTAIGVVNNYYLHTEYNAATLTIDAQGETIVMPFKNVKLDDWYKVTIIIKNGSVVSKFEDVTNGTIHQNQQLLYSNTSETGHRETVQDNGLFVKYGLYGDEKQNGFITGTAINYYTDETGSVEISGQGYRIERNGDNKFMFTFVFGGKNR